MGQLATSLSINFPSLHPVMEWFMSTQNRQIVECARLQTQRIERCGPAIIDEYDGKNIDDVVQKVCVNYTSPYAGLFDHDDNDDDDIDDLDKGRYCYYTKGDNEYDSEDDDDEDDADDDYSMGELDESHRGCNISVSRRGRRGGNKQIRETVACRHCQKVVAKNKAVQCPKCQSTSETYCSSECLKLREKSHHGKCVVTVQFKAVENVVKSAHPKEEFGCLHDLPGLEHEFLGGSKFSILLKIGREVPGSDGIFHCKDREGQGTKVKFNNSHAPLARGAITLCQGNQLYLPISKAWLQPLRHYHHYHHHHHHQQQQQRQRKQKRASDESDIGLVYGNDNIPLLMLYEYEPALCDEVPTITQRQFYSETTQVS